MTRQKYRPYFTLPELEEIAAALKQSPSPRRLQIAAYLEKFIIEIKHGVRKANHTLQPTMIEKLELETPVPLDHEITGEAAYQKWIINPSKCTAHEVEEALAWAYTNELMSPQQEAEYEEQKGL